MSAAVLAPAPPAVGGGGVEELAHYFCCTEQTGLCGTDLADTEDVDVADNEVRDCPLCLYVLDQQLPCPVPDCPGGTP